MVIGMWTYRAYRDTAYWHDFSVEVKRERDNKCERCGKTPWQHGVILDVHHNGYGNGYVDENGQSLLYRERERPDLMEVLYRECHNQAHGLTSLTSQAIGL